MFHEQYVWIYEFECVKYESVYLFSAHQSEVICQSHQDKITGRLQKVVSFAPMSPIWILLIVINCLITSRFKSVHVSNLDIS